MGSTRGRGVSQALLLPWGPLVEQLPQSSRDRISSCLEQGSLSFRVAFFERQGFLLRLLPRKWHGHPSFTGPGQGSSLTLTTGLGLSSSEGPGGMDGPCLSADRWKDSFSKENASIRSWPFYGQLNAIQQVYDESPGEILQ